MIIKTKYSLFRIVLVLAVIFNIALPKGGFDVVGIPITWGYIILFFIVFFTLFRSLLLTKIGTYRLQAYLLSLPFTICFIFYLFYVKKFSLGGGFLISCILSFVFFPMIFLLFFEEWIKKIIKDFDFFHKILLRTILFISVFGVLLFFYKIITGVAFEIPYLTVNIKDYGLLNSKHNNRGDGIFKLISTYSNGNIFGVCMFFLLPFTKNHKWHKIFLKLAMILTLSRTVWAGLIIYEIISYRKHFVKMALIGSGVVITLVSVMVFVLGKDMSYLLDPTLNGRLNGSFFQKIHLFFYDLDFKGITEMTYKSILEQMGIVGFVLFVVHFFSSLFVNQFYKLSQYQNEYQKQLKVGILTYLIAAFVDGAYVLIPVSLFLWFFNSLILTKKLKENE